jgi:hypothetical protein
MKVFTEFEQRSAEWWSIRRGRPTASEFHRIITPVQMKPSTSQDSFIDELIAEEIDQQYSIEPDDAYVSKSMQNGIDREDAARAWYSFEKDVDVTKVGFCLSDCGRYGCSPDGLMPELRGGLEIKCPDLKTHIRWLRNKGLPSDHRCQVHGELAVSDYDWWDFLSFSPCDDLPSLIVRVYPDSFTIALKDELERFLARYQAALKSVREPMWTNDGIQLRSKLGECVRFLSYESDVYAVSPSGGIHQFILPGHRMLTLQDGAVGLNAVNTLESDALEQVKAFVSMAKEMASA